MGKPCYTAIARCEVWVLHAWMRNDQFVFFVGQLDAVSDVHISRNSSTLSWDAPYSLDLTGVDPDVVYCVEVFNITCGRRDLIISDCNVTEPSYTSDVIGRNGYIYEYIVIPRNNVPGTRNGTPSQPLRGKPTDYLNTTVLIYSSILL